MKKILRKLKKGLGKAAKVVAPIGAAVLAAKAIQGRRNKKLLGETEDGKGGIDTTTRALQAMTSNDAYNDDTMPGMLSKDMGIKRRRRDSILASPVINKITDYYGESLKKGGRVGKKSKPKSGGKALRGYGRAYMKGKK